MTTNYRPLKAGETKKTCLNCKHLEWIDGEEPDGAGFTCNKRYDDLYYKSEEKADELLANLERDEYLKKPKKCCELKWGEDGV